MHGVVEYDLANIRGPLTNAFIILINALFFNIKLIGLQDIYPKDYSDFLLKEYEDVFDFIIVGAGSAGCSLANRLTENEQWSVLLVEAGDYPSTTSEVPALFPTLAGTKEDWHYYLEKDDHACKSYFLQRCVVSRGKVLGGTSSINDLLYIRGLTEDYDSNAFESWGSNITYTIFKKLEDYKGSTEFNINYGSDGFIKLEHTNYTGPAKDFLTRAYKDMGLVTISHRHALGFGDFLVMKSIGERKNMAKNFLTPIRDRPNLFFSKNTEVTAVEISENIDQRAIGVNVTIRGKELFLRARKEVILTAGPINNAKLLMLSGVGPADHLDDKDLPCCVDLPVGKNLQFHLTVPMYVAYTPGENETSEVDSETELIRDAFSYVIHRKGSFSHTNLNEFIVHVSTKNDMHLPNIAIRHFYFKKKDRYLPLFVDASKYHPRIRNDLLRFNTNKAIILFNAQLLSAKSRGELLLNDTDPLGNPKIIPRFMTDPGDEDFETLRSGFEFVTNLTDIEKDQLEFLYLDIPNCRSYKFRSPGYVRCYIENLVKPNRDAAGTTVMGADCETNAVVKENLEVKSIRCLRVADVSVLSHLTVGNTVATNAMIGFKMAEILREKWERGYKSAYTYFLKKAYRSMGLEMLSSKNFLGYADFLTTKTNGVRANMAKNFLSPIKHRRNFFLSKDTEVYDIELEDGIEKRAYGVWANIRGHNLLIKAKKEVILTAGPINNAKLLLLSGIGPRKYLMERNIPCCVELPGVGKDLQFRLTVPLFVSFKPSLTCKREAYCENDLINDVYEFIMHRTGDFTHTNVNEFLTLLSTIKKGISLPNIAIQHSYFKIDDRKLEAWIEAMDYDEHIRYKLQRFNRDKTIIMFNVQLLRPQSRAQLFLNDTYHNNNPTIIPNFLSDGQNNDYETLLSGFDFVTFMVSKMKDAGAEFLDLDIPNCRNFKFCTPSYVKCYIRNMATPTNDVIGGAAMGVEEPENNFVVKENLEMISIRGLRIADVSVLGTIPFGNTIGANAMLGFQAAEYLHERWEPEYQSPYMYVPETELTAYE